MPRKLTIAVATASLAAGLSASGVLSAPIAQAISPNCVHDRWGFLGNQTREICDDPIRPDGSWMRHRIIGHLAYIAKPSSHCSYSSYSSNCYYDEGGYVPEVRNEDEWYAVTFDTVLPGEPGHLPCLIRYGAGVPRSANG